jgi:hypothetical protein
MLKAEDAHGEMSEGESEKVKALKNAPSKTASK